MSQGPHGADFVAPARVFDLYAITPERPAAEIERSVARLLAIDGAARIGVLLRAKHLSPADRLALGRALRALTSERGAALLVSGELALTKQLAADGVQLPERGPSVAEARAALGTTAWIGASRHDARGLAMAAAHGASFATLSPVYASPDKGEPLGEKTFAALVRSAALPVFALGGVEPAHVAGLVGAGASGIAMIRALFDAPDPAATAAAALADIDQMRASLTLKPGAGGL